MENLMEEIRAAIWDHDAKKVKELVEKAVAEKIDIVTIVNDGLVGGMNKIGEKFKSNEVFIPEVLVSARAMAAGMTVIKPLLLQAGIKEKGTLVIGTVKDDLHDIGKNLVMMMFEGAGYKVVDLGINVSSETFVQAVAEHKPDVIGLAALLTTTMTNMKETTAAIKAKYPDAKIIVGGAPVTQRFADEIGADAYAADGAVAVEKADALLPA
ncbi:MAG: cobalamin-dependent protein [Negativicutes bacterium]|nr:cobalamin-dependent protein [Negativicutes bacterium]